MELFTTAKPTKMDRILEKTILWIIPKSVTPNQITALRFLSLPFVMYFLLVEEYKIAFPLFLVAAFTDALDGAMARTRNQITKWGKVFDPIADKLLIASSAIILISDQISISLAVFMVSVDTIIGLAAIYQYKVKKTVLNAHWTGKLKMILQSVGIALFLFTFVWHFYALKVIAVALLYASVGFGIVSLLVYNSA